MPINKDTIIKRTEKYVLFECGGNASSIINAKFIRNKEHTDYIFASVPKDFKASVRYSVNEGGKWVKRDIEVTAERFIEKLKEFNKEVENGYYDNHTRPCDRVAKDDLPF